MPDMSANLGLLLATVLWGLWGVASKQATSRMSFYTVQLFIAFAWGLSIPLWIYLRSRAGEAEPWFDVRGAAWALLTAGSTIGAMLCFVYAMHKNAGMFGIMAVSVYPLVSLLLLLMSGQERFSIHQLLGALLVVGGLFVFSGLK
jgi:drug/metabolite transporter (DMT)-like permease